jgi:hypothetical protein
MRRRCALNDKMVTANISIAQAVRNDAWHAVRCISLPHQFPSMQLLACRAAVHGIITTCKCLAIPAGPGIHCFTLLQPPLLPAASIAGYILLTAASEHEPAHVQHHLTLLEHTSCTEAAYPST